jgi:hemoglobin
MLTYLAVSLYATLTLPPKRGRWQRRAHGHIIADMPPALRDPTPGIDSATIERLVHTFYRRVRKDDVLGPIFETQIGDHWPQHLETLCCFWRSVLLASREYHGSPPQAHLRIQGIASQHFDRWLALFEKTVDELFKPPARARIIKSARSMRSTLGRKATATTEL